MRITRTMLLSLLAVAVHALLAACGKDPSPLPAAVVPNVQELSVILAETAPVAAPASTAAPVAKEDAPPQAAAVYRYPLRTRTRRQ